MDYQALKAAIGVEKAARWLGLKLKPDGTAFRCACPICQRAGDRAIIITPSKGRWYCHGTCKTGGDVIYLCAHVKQIRQSEAALLLHDQFMREPEKPKRSTSKSRRKTKVPAATPQTDYSIVDWLDQIGT